MKRLFYLLPLLLPLVIQAQRPELMVPKGHASYISAVAYSPDGQLILTGSEDNTAILWDRKGRQLKTLRGHQEGVTAVAFSPKGKNILTGSRDKTAKLWSLDGKELQTFEGHWSEILTVAFSPDGNEIVTGSDDQTTRRWNLEGQELQKLDNHTDYVRAGVYDVEVSPDSGKYIAAGSGVDTILLWNPEGKVEKIIKGFRFAFSPGGDSLVTIKGNTVSIWNTAGEELNTFQGHTQRIKDVAFAPDGEHILTASEDRTAILWDLNGTAVQTFRGHEHHLSTVAFSPDGQRVLTASLDKTARIWNLQGHPQATLRGYSPAISDFDLSNDGEKIVLGALDTTIRIFDLKENQLSGFPLQLGFDTDLGNVYDVEFSPDGNSVLTATPYPTLERYDMQGKVLNRFTTYAADYSGAPSATFSPKGDLVLIGGGSEDYFARTWDTNGEQKSVFEGHQYSISSVAFSPTGDTVLTGSSDKTAKLWDLEGHELVSLEGHEHFISTAVFSPDGKQILTGGFDQVAKLWNLDGTVERTFTGHTSWLNAVAFSPDQQQILTCSGDQTAKVWDLNGQELFTLRGHSNGVLFADYLQNGKYIITTSSDQTLRLWSPVNGEEIATFYFINDYDWVLTTPSGLFDASDGAMANMFYVDYSTGKYTVIALEQLKYRYWEPGLLQKILGFSNQPIRSVEGLDQIALYPDLSPSIEQDQLKIQIQERSGGIGILSVFVNGKEVARDINPQRQNQVSYDLSQAKKYLFHHPDSVNHIGLVAFNEAGWLKSNFIELEYRPAKSAKGEGDSSNSGWVGQSNPKMYVVSIGTSDYAAPGMNLKFANQDATSIALSMQSVGGNLFANGDSLEVYCLTTSTQDSTDLSGSSVHWQFANKENIKSTLELIKTRAKAEDILLVYLSGHGKTYGDGENAQFYYLTTSIASEDMIKVEDIRNKYTVSSDELTQWINQIAALKQVLIIDACNSGKVVENLTGGARNLNSSQILALDRMKDRTGMFVLSGSAADKVSYEASEYGQGLLTYSLLQGMVGVATRRTAVGDYVDVMKLFQYARNEVPRLAATINGIQTPMLGFPTTGASFDIGIVKDPGSILINKKKPVLIRSVFLNQTLLDDDLGLIELLEKKFREETERGKKADLIYVDTNQYPGAYSVKGLYTIKEGMISIRLKLFGNDEPQELNIDPTDDPERLVQNILKAVKKGIQETE
ncbi:eIF2A-related protein [Flavilitoribacter nigricans]|uniref:Peptidase C14 caspase domain-containing protein n=1 Tax=Flavilitoribacter nigricans (strain ATCC 23147 / DSM 23189 / NBRC 102662 / NCIMB 1420 / SS-2) TaxID=1122177 RepID=A0A2D0NH60_FLAN2|nr:caspase family protein [Flavilitoribacter nigricans]PHN07832.1 hypothetical protein CRP01_03520 [Flavilitoribacter nigricans DSM 23189 = NBRC 102662]